MTKLRANLKILFVIKVTKVSCNEKFSVQVKGKQPKDFKKLKKFYLIS